MGHPVTERHVVYRAWSLAWYVCYTRARHEHQVAQRLTQRGFESYVPLFPRIRQWKDRKKVVMWPLFPGYVFVRCTREDVSGVVSIAGVVSAVGSGGHPTPVRMSELESVRLLVKQLSEMDDEPERVPLEPGRPVRVAQGPLQGVEGVVVERRGRKYLVVTLSAIGRGLAVQINEELLEALQ